MINVIARVLRLFISLRHCPDQKDRIPSRAVLGNYADKLSKAGWSLGWVSAIDSEGRTLWIVDAHRDDESVSSHVRMKR
jgi:hypothetical protein